MSTLVQTTTDTPTSETTASVSTSSGQSSSSLLASMVAMMEALYAMEANSSLVMNNIADRQIETQQLMTKHQLSENKHLIHELHRIARKAKRMSKWGTLEKVGSGILVGISLAMAVSSGGTLLPLLMVAVGVMSMLSEKNNPIDMAAAKLAKSMGGGEGMDLLAKAILITAVIAVSCGAASGDAAILASTEAEGAAASTTTTMSTAAKLAAAQTLSSLNPLADALILTAKATGHDSEETEMILTIVAASLTALISGGLLFSASGSSIAEASSGIARHGIMGAQIVGAALEASGSIGSGATQISQGQIEQMQAVTREVLVVLSQVIDQLNQSSTEVINASSGMQKTFDSVNQNATQEANQFNYV